MVKEKQAEFKISQLRVISEAVNQSKDFSQQYTDKKIKSISWLMVGVVIVCFLGFITLIIDAFHINSITYREYSTKLDQYNENQQIIIDLQNQLLEKK